MEKIKVLITDDNYEWCELVSAGLNKETDLEVLGVAHHGVEALELVETLQPDVLLLDLIMPYLDGLGVLERLGEKTAPRPGIIVVTALGLEAFVRRVLAAGADYYIMKPFDLSVLAERIRMVANGVRAQEAAPPTASRWQEPNPQRCQLELEVTAILDQIGIPPNFKGYLYLRDCILRVTEDINCLNGIMKEVYPAVAARYQTTPVKVERAIRHALEIAWDRGDIDFLHSLFGNTIDGEKGRATNTLFIAKVADYIRLKTAQKRAAR